MDHQEALQQKATEGYLLNELSPETRDAFEEHLFDCHECALDLRAGAAFVDEAKIQLHRLAPNLSAPLPARLRPARVKREWWLSWLQPAFAAPAFATLLLLIGYQNLVVLPDLHEAANQPQLLAWAPLHGSTRGLPLTVNADHKHGLALPVDLPLQPASGTYAFYAFSLIDPQGKTAWTGSAAASSDNADQGQRLSLVIPGAMLRNGRYTVTVSGVTPQGEHSTVDQYGFDLHLTD
jgi:hypothetical protein